jgi:hypothetical protein
MAARGENPWIPQPINWWPSPIYPRAVHVLNYQSGTNPRGAVGVGVPTVLAGDIAPQRDSGDAGLRRCLPTAMPKIGVDDQGDIFWQPLRSTSSPHSKSSGVHRVYGVSGDSLNGFTDAIRRSDGIRWEHVRHEEAAALAATADAEGFSLYAIRTILAGRGDELLDLVSTNVARRLLD